MLSLESQTLSELCLAWRALPHLACYTLPIQKKFLDLLPVSNPPQMPKPQKVISKHQKETTPKRFELLLPKEMPGLVCFDFSIAGHRVNHSAKVPCDVIGCRRCYFNISPRKIEGEGRAIAMPPL